ncbi:hypothetical protein H6776_00510 [Candidatus Nomurabacteria bacterium]|nr:hypothetical protein [Candidatus Nomurabacteria bacterium]
MITFLAFASVSAQEFYKRGKTPGKDPITEFKAWAKMCPAKVDAGYRKILGPAWDDIKAGRGVFSVGPAPAGYLNHGIREEGYTYSSQLIAGTECIWWAMDNNTVAIPIAKLGDNWCFNPLKKDIPQSPKQPSNPNGYEYNQQPNNCCCCNGNNKPSIVNPPADYSTDEPEIKVESWDFDQGGNNGTTNYKTKGKAGKIIGYTFAGIGGAGVLGAGIYGLTQIKGKSKSTTTTTTPTGDPQPPVVVNTGGGGVPGSEDGGTFADETGGTPGSFGGGKWDGAPINATTQPTMTPTNTTSIMFIEPQAEEINISQNQVYKPTVGFTVGITTTIGDGKFFQNMLPKVKVHIQ